MTPDTREAWLREVISRISGKSAAEVGVEEDLQDAVGLDSLGKLEVLAEIEDAFDFFFEDNDMAAATTIARMLRAIDERLAETPEAVS